MTRAGAANANWKGGRVRGGHEGRYWMRHVPDHPAANAIGYVLEHRLVVEEQLGRYLMADEVVHHLNEDPADNRPENLQVMTRADHAREHFMRTECRRGHRMEGENVYQWTAPDGKVHRQCRACVRLRYEQKKAAAA